MAGRTLISKLSSFSNSAAARFSTASVASRSAAAARASPLNRLRPLIVAGAPATGGAAAGTRWLSTRATTSSLNDPTPNWSNRPPKETILLDGCDFEHWLVVVEPPDQSWTRDQIIESYIETLAKVVESAEEARFKIYSVSTKHYFAFGALVSEELSYKLKELPNVRWVLPDSYLDVKNKDYGGEPFINGEAVPYDPKYHEEWVRNNARANERSRRNDRPRDRSRNFDRRRENMQTFQNREAPPVTGNNAQNTMPPPPPPPVANNDFSARPNVGPPGAGYQNQIPNPQNNYAPDARGPPAGPAYQGNSQGYQGGNSGGGDPYYQQGGNSGYQRGPPRPAYQQGPPPPYQQGSGPGYQQGPPPPYQRPPPSYQQGPPPPPPHQPGGGPAYQQGPPSPPHQYGDSPPYQQGPPQPPQHGADYQQGVPSYQSGPGFQGRDVPGRDQ